MRERITTKKVKKSQECNKKELKMIIIIILIIIIVNNSNSNDYNDGKRKGKALKVYLKRL